MKVNTYKKAFSLLELIFVIVVLAIIASVAVPKLSGTKSSAIVSTIKQDIATISSSVQTYHLLNDGIESITDSVSIDASLWENSDDKLIFKKDGENCVEIYLDGSSLKIDIKESASGQICKEIYQSGVRDNTIDMI